MKCILLAAGYATRLFPLTVDIPKPLLDVCGKTVLERILNKIEEVCEIDEIYIVSNAKFFKRFRTWLNCYVSNKTIEVLNDNTFYNDGRLGAIGDIRYAVKKKDICEDVLIMAADNLFDFDLCDFIEYYRNKGCDCITAHRMNDIASLRKTGVVTLDNEGKVLSFEEKPEKPESDLAVPPFYIYKHETLTLIDRYLDEGNNPDAPGNFIPWLIMKKDVYAFRFEGKRYDIGSPDSYRRVQEIFRGR